ncbi:hypothetical protein A2881_04630 [Candidatus Peribacteria bacterium RIFCSPHIGHO2_01_FULL_55_13]|nr:MAG: hypothetical protein A2881_04630 [Candidatus Peribacteria bacterium RIFCSPHIGHO2_01_FULL_55_13]OGJ65541.1 MAG: hypothetical protein A3F36_04240 [Candidatus Peribacteria bacterium RIFCSPHIGHO2_12_FULL_55_11]
MVENTPSTYNPQEVLASLREKAAKGFDRSDLTLFNTAITVHITEFSLTERGELSSLFGSYQSQFEQKQDKPAVQSQDPFRIVPPLPADAQGEEPELTRREDIIADGDFFFERLMTELEQQSVKEIHRGHPSLRTACTSIFDSELPQDIRDEAVMDVIRAINAGELRKKVGWTLCWLLVDGVVIPIAKAKELFGQYYRAKRPYKD